MSPEDNLNQQVVNPQDKTKYIVAIWILSFLAVGGIGFGIFELIKNIQYEQSVSLVNSSSESQEEQQDTGEFSTIGALQQSQRDTERRNDYALLASSVLTYQANNRSKFPTDPLFIEDYINGDFTDPSGDPYDVEIVEEVPQSAPQIPHVYIVLDSTCDTYNNTPKTNSGSRRAVIYGGLELSGPYCVDV